MLLDSKLGSCRTGAKLALLKGGEMKGMGLARPTFLSCGELGPPGETRSRRSIGQPSKAWAQASPASCGDAPRRSLTCVSANRVSEQQAYGIYDRGPRQD